MKTYRDLFAWQKAMSLVTEIYRMTGMFPKEEIYGITSQMRRCAVSIPSNIAEGYGRHSRDDYLRFLQMAMSSLFEIQTQMEIAMNLKYVEKNQFDEVYQSSREIERILAGLIQSVRVSPSKPRSFSLVP
ncbi:MAG: four helix bundle protein [Verrucomicrobiae bacterium]|nr:four helix bundle protein [Verrucomicrobiae bacterium]